MTDQPAIIVPTETRMDICAVINLYTNDIIEYKEQIALSKTRRNEAEKIIATENVIIRGLSDALLKSNTIRDALLRDNLASALYFVKDDKVYAIPKASAADRAKCEADPTVRVIEYTSITILDRTRIHWVVPEDDNPGE